MLHSILVSDDRESAELLGSLARACGDLKLDGTLPASVGSYLLTRALQTLDLDVVFLDVSNVSKAQALYRQIREYNSRASVIGFATNGCAPASDVTPFSLQFPLSLSAFQHTLREAVRGSRQHPLGNVFAILPAKAGGGASTIAINTAQRVAQCFGKRVLVAECDLHSGTIAETLGLRLKESMARTLQSADAAETLMWSRHVCRKDEIDFLLTAREWHGYQPSWHDYHHLLSFVAKRYDCVLFDLPEVIDDAASEVVWAAKRVYVMTTPEISSLDLARQRLAELRLAGVPPQRTRILVNRYHAGDPTTEQLSELLDCPVEMTLPNDYRAVQAATYGQKFVAPQTALGRSYTKLASLLEGAPDPAVAKRSFFGFLRPATRYAESPIRA
jgi:MinD-like ATPase involved in chromosome partitioning or flagellar assembly